MPQAFGEKKTQLISLEEGVGKMKAAVDGRSDPSLVILARTGAISVTSLGDAIERGRAYQETGVDGLFFTGIKSRDEVEAISEATRLPIVLGGAPEEMIDLDWLAEQARAGSRCRAMRRSPPPRKSVYETLKALREGTCPSS